MRGTLRLQILCFRRPVSAAGISPRDSNKGQSNQFRPVLRLVAICLVLGLVCCSDHVFDNPLDPDNQGQFDEYLMMFQSPVDEPGDLAWDGVYLWQTDAGRQELVQFNPISGVLARVLASPLPHPAGLAFDGQSLWVSDPVLRRISQIDPLTGREIFHFSSPGSNPRGLAWNSLDNQLYCIDANSLTITAINPTNGQHINQFSSPSRNPWGLAWNDGKLHVAGFSENRITFLDATTGQEISSREGPHLGPVGLAWGLSSLWIADWDGMVYRLTSSDP